MSGRIAYLVSQYPATSHTFIRREVEAMRRHGVDIDTFSVRRPSAAEIVSPDDATAHDTTFYILPLSPLRLIGAHLSALMTGPVRYLATFGTALKHRAPGLRALLWSLFHFVESIVLARELRRRSIAHLHNHFANAGATVGYLAAHYLRLPWSLTLHGISETDYPAGLMLADKVRAAQFVACVSWFGRAQAMRLVEPDQWPKFETVRCALDLNALAPIAQTARAEQQSIVCVGRLSSEKGHYGLLSALAAVRSQGVDAKLTLIGDGPEGARLKAMAAALLPEDAVMFAGRLDEIATLAAVAQADLLVLPSFMEGLPVVLMEAMALGTPVISSRIAGVPELITEGVEGRLFTPANWDELAQVLAQALTETEATARMAVAAREKIAREFDIEKAVFPLIERFDAAVSAGDGGPAKGERA
ncbi:MAG: glycosyltransferase family 4 protein [Pseudomonadota bacterium]